MLYSVYELDNCYFVCDSMRAYLGSHSLPRFVRTLNKHTNIVIILGGRTAKNTLGVVVDFVTFRLRPNQALVDTDTAAADLPLPSSAPSADASSIVTSSGGSTVPSTSGVVPPRRGARTETNPSVSSPHRVLAAGSTRQRPLSLRQWPRSSAPGFTPVGTARLRGWPHPPASENGLARACESS